MVEALLAILGAERGKGRGIRKSHGEQGTLQRKTGGELELTRRDNAGVGQVQWGTFQEG